MKDRRIIDGVLATVFLMIIGFMLFPLWIYENTILKKYRKEMMKNYNVVVDNIMKVEVGVDAKKGWQPEKT